MGKSCCKVDNDPNSRLPVEKIPERHVVTDDETIGPVAPLSVGESTAPGVCTQLVLVSDPGQDLDDEMTFIMLRYLTHIGLASVRGIIVTLAPVSDRARLCRGTLDTLGMPNVPVAVGTDGGDLTGTHKASTFEDWAVSYMPRPHSE